MTMELLCHHNIEATRVGRNLRVWLNVDTQIIYIDISLPWERTYAYSDLKSLGSVRPRRRRGAHSRIS